MNNGIATFQTNLTDAKASVTSYVVASNPEVLAKLMSDANKRQIHNPNEKANVLVAYSYKNERK